MELTIHKARPAGLEFIEDTTIKIEGEAPTPADFNSSEKMRKFYQREANILASVLTHALPVGTLEYLAIYLMERNLMPYRSDSDLPRGIQSGKE